MDIVFNPRKSVLTLPFTELVNEVARGLRVAAQTCQIGGNEMKQVLQFALREVQAMGLAGVAAFLPLRADLL